MAEYSLSLEKVEQMKGAALELNNWSDQNTGEWRLLTNNILIKFQQTKRTPKDAIYSSGYLT